MPRSSTWPRSSAPASWRQPPSQAKVVLSGELKKAVTLKGIGATKGALAAITAAGGKLED